MRSHAKVSIRIKPIAKFIPDDQLELYVKTITKIFVGYKGSSMRFNRTDFYSDRAAPYIRKMFQAFDDKSTDIFVEAIKTDRTLRRRIKTTGQLRRLRILGNILIEHSLGSKEALKFIELLCDESKESKFYRKIFPKKKKS